MSDRPPLCDDERLENEIYQSLAEDYGGWLSEGAINELNHKHSKVIADLRARYADFLASYGKDASMSLRDFHETEQENGPWSVVGHFEDDWRMEECLNGRR